MSFRHRVRHHPAVDGDAKNRWGHGFAGESINKRSVLFAVACLLALPGLASEPGQRMECSDIVFGEPGHSCSVAVSHLPPLEIAGPGIGPIQPFFLDNEGKVYLVVKETRTACADWPYPGRWEIRRLNSDGSYSVAISSQARCVSDGTLDYVDAYSFPAFDAVNGRVIVPMRSSCFAANALCTNYVPLVWFAAIDGFPTLSDVLPKSHKH